MLLLEKHLELKNQITQLEQEFLDIQRSLMEHDFSIEIAKKDKEEELRMRYKNLTLQANPKILTLPNSPKSRNIDQIILELLQN